MIIGVIGVGNMSRAIIDGALKGGFAPGDFLLLEHAPQKGHVTAYAKERGLPCRIDRQELIAASDMVMLGVKPNVLGDIASDLKDAMRDKAAISIAAGWSTKQLQEVLPGARILRTTPNTPLQVGMGFTGLSLDHTLSENEYQVAKRLFEASGEVDELPERLLSAAGTVAGCSPAFLCMFIDALADAGVRAGLPRQTAIHMAATAVKGSGEMVLKTGQHPDALKDAVCSPGGTTIEGVYALEKGGFRAAIIDAVDAAIEKSKKLV